VSLKQPAPPDPQQGIALGNQVAQGQQQYNTSAGEMSQAGSMVDQYNPYGSLTYAQTGTGPNGVPLYSANVNLTPQQQQMFDLLQGTKTTAGQQGQNLITNANYGASSPGDVIGNLTKGNTADLIKTQTDYYKPFFQSERDSLDTQLRNQGLAPGMPAYDRAMRGLDTSHGLVLEKAAGDFENQAYNQAKSMYEEPAALGENLAAFGAPMDPTKDFVNTPGLNIQPANLTGAVAGENQALNDAYKAKQAQYSSMMSGLMGIPTAILGGWAKGGFPGLGTGSSLTGDAAQGAGGLSGVTEAAGSGGFDALTALQELGPLALI
jgi:hypothetical protein